MYKYVISRVIQAVGIVFLVIFFTFTLMEILPGEPGRMILGPSAGPDQVQMFRDDFQLDRPFVVRFTEYVWNIATDFDFGISYRTREPIVGEILHRLPITFRLAWMAVVFSAILGIPLGVLAAVKRSTIVDASTTVWAIIIGVMPGFWLAMILQLGFSIHIGWMPIFGADTWRHYVLPIMSMAIPGSSGFIRLTRAVMLDTVHMEYVRTARAKGCSERIVIWKHAFKNAILPIINASALTFSALLGGSVLTEQIFGMHGVGMYALEAARGRDIPVVMATTIFLATIFCLIVVAIDLIYAFIDPRIKAKFSS